MRNRRRGLLGKKDSGVWSGILNTDFYEKRDGTTIIYKDTIGSNPNYRIYSLEIPKKANFLSLRADNTMALNPAWVSFSNNSPISSPIFSTDYSLSGKSSLLNIPVNNSYKFVYIPIMNTSRKVNVTFEFTKNSGGGTKLLTYLLNLFKRGLSR